MDYYCSLCGEIDRESRDGYSSCCNEFVDSKPPVTPVRYY
jgi:hypothetical protein